MSLLIVGVLGLRFAIDYSRIRFPIYRPPNTALLEAKARQFCAQKGVAYPLNQPSVVIHKSARHLQIYEGKHLIGEFRIALSVSPKGDKAQEGDRKVPEGRFYICEKHYSARFYLFLGLSYPSIEDAERGKNTGPIDKSQYDAIKQAHKQGTCPPWNTPLGGAIGIHGGGVQSDWTIGCIAMKNQDVELLYMLLPVGTPVSIQP